MTRTLHDLLTAAGLPCPAGADAIAITSITDDSRQVQPGSLFVAYQGVEADGHKYIPDAVKRGATAILFENELKIENEEQRKSIFSILHFPFSISVANGRRAFALLSAAWRDFPSRSMT